MKLSALFIALIPLLGSPVIHAETTAAPVLENRAAQGDITTPGGARRLTGDQTEALRASLINKPAKNVILLIGDGMGDSEITAARNYAEGAGGFFKGIDALPLTGQYTHYSLDKKTGKPDYVTDSAASATAWTTGVKTYNGALGVDHVLSCSCPKRCPRYFHCPACPDKTALTRRQRMPANPSGRRMHRKPAV